MSLWAPGPKLTPNVLLQGTQLTHRTDLAFALNDYAPFIGPRKYRYHPPLVSAEWGAFTPYPWGRGLIGHEPGERMSDGDLDGACARIVDWMTETGGLWAPGVEVR